MFANVIHWCMADGQTLKIFINSFKYPYPSYLVLKFGNVLPRSNQDTVQILIFQRS